MRASLLGKRGSQTGSRRPAPPIAALVLILAAVSGLGCGGSPTPPSPPPPSPSTLVGEWVLVTSDRPGAPSGIGVRRKVFTQTTWSITQRDPATGDVVFHHGGTYTLSRKVMFPNSLIHLLDVRFPGQTWVTGVLDPERRGRDQKPASRKHSAGWHASAEHLAWETGCSPDRFHSLRR
jgi:hypothetical protein